MIYEVWKDAEGKRHIVSEMETIYIKRCIKQLEIVIREYGLKQDEARERNGDSKYPVLSEEWSRRFANGFLDAFNDELKKRAEEQKINQ